MKKLSKGAVVLESGVYFLGKLFGSTREATGEVVFNTALTGYEEVLTDPSYKGQIVVMTYPHIGNYGVNPSHFESKKPVVNGFVAREFSKTFSNPHAKTSIENLFKKHRITAIEEVDTRALTNYLREKGAMMGMITQEKNISSAIKKLKKTPPIGKLELVKDVSVDKPVKFHGKAMRIAILDGGCKRNIIRIVNKYAQAILLPYSTAYNELMRLKPDGAIISNGPGDPLKAKNLIKLTEKILDKFPLLGICLGHQIIALAAGSKTYKLKFGHHGVNHPVKSIETGKIYITSQNHNYAVESDGNHIKNRDDFIITHINLNDGSVEGFRHKKLPVYAVQFHPEASPGPLEANHIIEDFLKICQKEMI